MVICSVCGSADIDRQGDYLACECCSNRWLAPLPREVLHEPVQEIVKPGRGRERIGPTGQTKPKES